MQEFNHGQVTAVYLYHSDIAGVLDVVVKEELNFGTNTYPHDSAARKRMAQEAKLNERVHGYGLFLKAGNHQEPDRILLRYLPFFERAGFYRQLKTLLFEECKRDDPLALLDHENEFRRDKMQALMCRKVNIMADLKSYFLKSLLF